LTTPTSSDTPHNPKYIASLALAAALILIVGFLFKPRPPASEAPPPPTQVEIQRLARLSERRALDTMTEHFSAVARGVSPRVLHVSAGGGTGILWDPSLVVTAGSPAPDSMMVTTGEGHLLTATRTVAGPHLPLAAYGLPGESRLPAARVEQADTLAASEWVLAVWHDQGELNFAPGHFLETRPATCAEQDVEEVLTSVALSPVMVGGGLFDLDGALVAVILSCGDGHVAVSPKSVSRLVEQGRGFEAQVLALHGMRTAPLNAVARSHLGLAEGALVTEIWSGHGADVAGLRPGDVIVGLSDQPVGAPEDLQPLLLPPDLGPRIVRVRRGKATVEVDLSPASGEATSTDGTEDHGIGLEQARAGFTIGSVESGSCGADAGLQAGDRIVRVGDQVPRNATELSRALSRRPVFLEIERGPRRLGRLLQ
jgi:S1-C subfamily serine protease